MPGSRLPREARRRPELDLLVGPLEAAAGDPAAASVTQLTLVELPDLDDEPTWREDG